MAYISIKNISKTFKVSKKTSGFIATLKNFFNRQYVYIKAIDDISFDIEKGEIVGYIGPNGAGKSTTIKILCGILVPDKGKVTINGLIPFKERKKYVSKIGVVFGQKSQLWWDVPAIDTYDLLKEIYSLDEKEYKETLNDLIKLLDIEEIVKMPVRQLSLGQRMRCEIAAALIHRPEILFLDEPTIGLDAVSKKIVRDFIKKINKQYNTTVILTSHDMDDIESLAKRIIMIGKGKVLYDGTLNNVKKKYDTNKKITIYTNNHVDEIKKNGIINQKKVTDGYEYIIDTTKITVSSFINYLSKNVEIKDINVESENIDDIIIKMYKEYEV